ncbi:MAG: DUF6191 domain-containing protein [Pseudonocardia sp.]|nr:DUF6191 domain-containing protein [Pseudonocardia sp.]
MRIRTGVAAGRPVLRRIAVASRGHRSYGPEFLARFAAVILVDDAVARAAARPGWTGRPSRAANRPRCGSGWWPDVGIGLLFALTLPGLVCLLVLLAALERLGFRAGRRSRLPWRRGSLPLSGTGVEEVDAFFTGAKRAELQERHSQSQMRDEEGDGAPPRTTMDLDRGVITFVRCGPAGSRNDEGPAPVWTPCELGRRGESG